MSNTEKLFHVAIGILRSTNVDSISQQRGILIGSNITLSYLIAKSLSHTLHLSVQIRRWNLHRCFHSFVSCTKLRWWHWTLVWTLDYYFAKALFNKKWLNFSYPHKSNIFNVNLPIKLFLQPSSTALLLPRQPHLASSKNPLCNLPLPYSRLPPQPLFCNSNLLPKLILNSTLTFLSSIYHIWSLPLAYYTPCYSTLHWFPISPKHQLKSLNKYH